MSTIYIDEQGVVLKRSGDLIIVEKEDKKLTEIPIAICDRMVIAGNVQITTQTLTLFFQKQIPVSFMSIYGNYKGKLTPSTHKNVLLRVTQYEKYKDEKFRIKISKELIKTKIKNSKTFLQKHQRNNEEIDIEKELNATSEAIASIEDAQTIEQLNGIEGATARSYFQAYGKFFKKEFTLKKHIFLAKQF
jgi:CRISPR-associated protein Cas1